jgi:hypothetical protein
VDFLYFFGSGRFTLAQLMSSSLFLLPGATSPSTDVATPPRRVVLPLYEAKMSSLPSLYLLVMLCPVASSLQPKSKYWIHITTTLHCYKKIISTLITLVTTQSHLYFTSSLAKAPYHLSFTHCRRSLSSTSYAHHPSAQWHLWWWINRPLSLSEQLIDTWIHVNIRYFEI